MNVFVHSDLEIRLSWPNSIPINYKILDKYLLYWIVVHIINYGIHGNCSHIDIWFLLIRWKPNQPQDFQEKILII